MTVTEFTKLCNGDNYFAIVDANRQGYVSTPRVLIEGDKNVVRKEEYGDREVIGFDVKTKKTILLYTKEVQ